MNKYDEFDIERLIEARNKVIQVQTYYSGSRGYKRFCNKLERVIKKMDEVILEMVNANEVQG